MPSVAVEPDRLVDSRELASRLGVTRRTVKRYRARGWIRPTVRHRCDYFWDFRECVAALHAVGICEHIPLPPIEDGQP